MGKILIAGGTVPFAGWLAAQLQAEGGHSVRVTATEAPREPLPRGVEFVLCGLDHNDTYSLGEAVYYGVEQIILLTNCSAFVGADDDDADDTAWLDVATRGCYNLLCAATAAEVRRVVVVSCMDVFASYGEDLAVDENFRPRPSLAPKQLGPHLTEYLTREFAHTHGGLNVTVARLGLLSPTNYGADEQRAVEALSELIDEDAATEQGRRSNGQFYHPPRERTRFTIRHLAQTGPTPRSPTTLPLPAVSPMTEARSLDRVLILGGGGILGPSVVDELGEAVDETVDETAGAGPAFSLRVTDVHADKRNPGSAPLQLPEGHEYVEIDIATKDEVVAAIEGTDAVVNLSVMRLDRKLSFDVNTTGVYHAIMAAVEAGHDRFINTGPHFTVVGTLYDDYDFGISEDVPPHPGINLYAITKALGQEICKVVSENAPIHVLANLYWNLGLPAAPAEPPAPEGAPAPAPGVTPFAVTVRDAARAIRASLSVPLAALPSRCEVFFVMVPTLPHGRFKATKAKDLLGWEPMDNLEAHYSNAATAGSKL